MTQHHLAASIAESRLFTSTAIKLQSVRVCVVVCDVKPFCEFGLFDKFAVLKNVSKVLSGVILEFRRNAFHISHFKNVTCREQKLLIVVRRRPKAVFFTAHHHPCRSSRPPQKSQLSQILAVRRWPLLHSPSLLHCRTTTLVERTLHIAQNLIYFPRLVV